MNYRTARPHHALFASATAALLLSGCVSWFGSSDAVTLGTGTVPVEAALPQLQYFVGQRITVSGLPRQSEGRCLGVQPLSRRDWMLTGENDACLWVSGQSDDARILDLRSGMSKKPVTVSGQLIRTDRGIYVLKLDQ